MYWLRIVLSGSPEGLPKHLNRKSAVSFFGEHISVPEINEEKRKFVDKTIYLKSVSSCSTLMPRSCWMQPWIVHCQFVPAFKFFVANITRVTEQARKVDGLYMVSHKPFSHSCELSTYRTLKIRTFNLLFHKLKQFFWRLKIESWNMVTFVKFTVLQKQELEHNAKLSDHFTEIRHTQGYKNLHPSARTKYTSRDRHQGKLTHFERKHWIVWKYSEIFVAATGCSKPMWLMRLEGHACTYFTIKNLSAF